MATVYPLRIQERHISDEGYLASVRKAREESVRFFDAANKPERERWVANEFLGNLGVEFVESEIQCVADEPPDIRFRSASFEVKEILDKGRRRHLAYKAALEVANSASSPRDLLEPVTPRDITYTEVCNLVEAEVIRFAKKYAPETRNKLDLLFYVNLEDVFGYVATPLPPPSKWEVYGFRSVSLVMGRLAGVLMAAQTAPDFLKNNGPRIILKPRDHEKNAIYKPLPVKGVRPAHGIFQASCRLIVCIQAAFLSSGESSFRAPFSALRLSGFK